VLLGTPIVLTAVHLPYYAAPLGERLRHPLHALLRPSGGVGLSFGLVCFSFFLFMWLYPIRKRVRWLARAGPVSRWLRVHTIAGLSLPGLGALHAGWRFDGVIGLGYLAMLIVCLSGVIGRYLYVRIPRSRTGLELTLDEVAGERRSIVTRIAAATGLDPKGVEAALAIDPAPYTGLGPLRAIGRLARDDFVRARTIRRLERAWSKPRDGTSPLAPEVLHEVLTLARREITLDQRMKMLDATRRIFGYWHVAHFPFAATALLAVVVHVLVAVFIGGVDFRVG